MRDVYAGIDQLVLVEGLQASKVCDLLEVSRSGFYTWRGAQESRREVRDRELIPWISAVFWWHRRRYGARRIAVELASQGIACGVARVARLLKTQGFRAIQPKSYKPRTTESRHRLGYNHPACERQLHLCVQRLRAAQPRLFRALRHPQRL